MHPRSAPHRTGRVALALGLSLGLGALTAGPAAAQVSIPDGGNLPPDRVSPINFRVVLGCDGSPTDRLEVEIPAGVVAVLPEAVPGWDVEVFYDDDAPEGEPSVEPGEVAGPAEDEDDRPDVRRVVWSGGSVPDGQFAEFGLRARFPDEPGASLAFPTIQSCGSMERRLTGGPDSDTPAPRVRIRENLSVAELNTLADTVEQLSAEVDDVAGQLTNVDPQNLRRRVGEVESQLQELQETVADLQQRLEESLGAEEPTEDGS